MVKCRVKKVYEYSGRIAVMEGASDMTRSPSPSIDTPSFSPRIDFRPCSVRVHVTYILVTRTQSLYIQYMLYLTHQRQHHMYCILSLIWFHVSHFVYTPAGFFPVSKPFLRPLQSSPDITPRILTFPDPSSHSFLVSWSKKKVRRV